MAYPRSMREAAREMYVAGENLNKIAIALSAIHGRRVARTTVGGWYETAAAEWDELRARAAEVAREASMSRVLAEARARMDRRLDEITTAERLRRGESASDTAPIVPDAASVEPR